jgi:hypothetical protein
MLFLLFVFEIGVRFIVPAHHASPFSAACQQMQRAGGAITRRRVLTFQR